MFTEEEFLKALASFGEIIPDPIEYRFHYNNLGNITMCSMQNHPVSEQYLVVDQKIYENYTHYRINVEKKKLEKVVFDPRISVKYHAGLIIESDEIYENIEYYDNN